MGNCPEFSPKHKGLNLVLLNSSFSIPGGLSFSEQVPLSYLPLLRGHPKQDKGKSPLGITSPNSTEQCPTWGSGTWWAHFRATMAISEGR